VLIGSCTLSEDFPVSANAVQANKSIGQDGVFFQLNPQLSNLTYSTFVGGNGADAVYAINYFPDGSVLTGGGTSSNNLPMPASAFQGNFQGGEADGFVYRFAPGFASIDAGTYFGTSSYDQVYFVERDNLGNPHVYGQTESSGASLLVNADYGLPGRGMFVSKFDPNLDGLDWSTTFGNVIGVPPLSPVAFSVDICNRIYLSGWGGTVNFQGNTFNLDVTDDALQSTTDGSDFYFMVLDGDGSGLSFATYFGGNISAEHVDGGTSRFDRGGKIYQAVCAGCGSNDDFPIFPANALSATNNSSNCNLGVAKIDFDLPLVLAGFQAESVCLPSPVDFVNTSETFSEGNPSYTWIFPGGSTSSEENPSFFFDTPGTYDVTLIISDPESCNLADTITQSIEVFSELELNLPAQVADCESDTLSVTALTGGAANSFVWAEDPGFESLILSGPTNSILVVAPQGLDTVWVQVSNGLCAVEASVVLAPAFDAELSLGDTLLCNVDEIEVTVLANGNYNLEDILWSPNEAVISGQGNTTALFDLTNPLVISVSATNQFGCTDAPEAILESYPIALTVSNDTLVCNDDPLSLIADSDGTAESFVWSTEPDFSDPINDPQDSTISVTPGAYEIFYVLVDNNGCSLIDSVGLGLLGASTEINENQFICAGDTTLLFVETDFPTGNLNFVWEPAELVINGANTPIVHVVVNETTTFMVTTSSNNGCVVEDMTTVFVSDLGNQIVEATASPTVINPGASSQLNVIPQNEEFIYQWEPATYLNNAFIPDPVSTPEETTVYVVTVTDVSDDGFCAKSDTVIIQVFETVCGPPSIFVPNAFTPNDDGENDILFVRGANITDLSFSIYNRWGETVFETDDLNKGWDGSYKGNLAEPAVFVYHLEAVCGDGQEYFEKGNITLIR
jgi:gliding motility-associated-like protein